MQTSLEAKEEQVSRLSPQEISLTKNDQGEIKMEVRGTVFSNVEIFRPFPLNDELTTMVAFRDAGTKQEIGILPNYEELDPVSRQIVAEELDIFYFIPKIKRIYHIGEEFGVLTWQVETDRGSHTFEVRGRYNLRRYSKWRLIIKDVDGNRYEIPNLNELDKHSRSLLEAHM